MTVYICIFFYVIMFLGSYVKDYIGIGVLLIIYFFVYSYCSFLLYVKKLIKVGFKLFY